MEEGTAAGEDGKLSDRTRLLGPADRHELDKQLAGSWAYRNICLRLEATAKRLGRELVAALESDYPEWEGLDAELDGNGPHARAGDRLILLDRRKREDRPGYAYLPVAVLVISSGAGASRLRRRRYLRRVLIIDTSWLVEESALLLSTRHHVYLPWLEPGERVAFDTFPFTQQDSNFFRCIDVSLWMAFEYFARLMDGQRISVHGIRSLRARRESPFLPVRGLHANEIVGAIADAGLNPVEFRYPQTGPAPPAGQFLQGSPSLPARRFVEVLHAYVRSGIPVVLVIARYDRGRNAHGLVERIDDGAATPHSLLVVGLVEPDQPEPPPRIAPLSTEWWRARALVVHDDDIGPYLQLNLHGTPPPVNRDHLHLLWGETVAESALAMYVAHPRHVRQTMDDALRHGRYLLGPEPAATLRGYLSDLPQPYLGADDTLTEAARNAWGPKASLVFERFVEARQSGTMGVSVFLDYAARVRRNAAAAGAGDPHDRAVLSDLRLPKYVYVVEFLLPNADPQDTSPRQAVGEAILDASVASLEASLVFARFPGMRMVLEGTPARWDVSVPSLREQWSTRKFGRVPAASIRPRGPA